VAGAPTTLVIHGVRNTVQSNELYETIRSLESGLRERCTWIRIVIISRPELLRRVSDADPEIMNHVCTMYVPDTGPMIYSGKSSSPPLLNEVWTNLPGKLYSYPHLESLFVTVGWYPP
jgi:hypothetical protein